MAQVTNPSLKADSRKALAQGGATDRCGKGVLIVNADDWGRDRDTTDRTFDCFRRGSVSAVSAMVFMEDSERAAALARKEHVDAGLHLNFTTVFSSNCAARLLEHQRLVAKFLLGHPFARGIFNPWLMRSFEYLVKAQRDEFIRLYGAEPERIDGHHHMHLSANVLFAGLLPQGTVVRPHFSYEPGEKVLRNFLFRRYAALLLARRYRHVDFLFSIVPLDLADRLLRIFSLAAHSVVEVETHPINPGEYRFLAEGGIFRWAETCPIAARFARSA